jgi:hypothetical protein
MLYSGIFPRGETETIPNNVDVRLNNQTSKCISHVQWPMRDAAITTLYFQLHIIYSMYRLHHVLFFKYVYLYFLL